MKFRKLAYYSKTPETTTTMTEKIIFKSDYILRILKGDFHPFTPNVLILDDNHIEYRRRNWHLVSVDTESLHYTNITGVTIDKHLFGATITIKSKGNDPIRVSGFWKKDANEIQKLCTEHISESSFRSDAPVSVADELIKLKELLDNGVLTQAEFEVQKNKILSK